jgi:DNA (cytosine-5)-methyltransferase 1
MNVIDLFAGAGGLSVGFFKAGHKVTKAVEFDPSIARTYQLNHPGVDVIVNDIRNIDASGLFRAGDVEVIIGGPPCQGFSMAGARIRKAHSFMEDPRNYLFKHYFNIVRTVKPKIFVIENVKGIQTMQGGLVFEEILRLFSDPKQLDGCPYQMFPKVVKAKDFGVPQKRERMIIVGVSGGGVNFEQLWRQTRGEVSSELPTFFEPVTVSGAIGNLPDATEDGVIDNPEPRTAFQRYLATDAPKLQNHTKSRHSEVAINRMKQIANGENFSVLTEPIRSVHSGAYGRLSWDELAPTITTRFDTPSGGRYTHPVENRTLTLREAARLQSFPDGFIFSGNKTSVIKQIGNAVPPKVSYFLANLVRNIIETE